jgi:hypothetical protein
MNSTSDIVDELDGIKKSFNNTEIKTNKTIEDILQKNIENIENVLDSKVINIYARSWTKLEPKLKIRKINEYYELNSNNSEKVFVLKYILNKKKVVVDYDVSECSIKSIKVFN